LLNGFLSYAVMCIICGLAHPAGCVCVCMYGMDVLWLVAFSALTLLDGRQEELPACKNMGDGGGEHWLVQVEWRPARWSMCLPLLILPCTIKSRSSLLAPAHTVGPREKWP